MISSSLVACILLLPRYTLPRQRTIMRSSLPAMYETAKEKLLIQLSQIKTCAVTTDFWTSASSESYITVTCHFLTSTWELDSHILNTYQVKMQHTGDNIAAELMKVADNWKISDKITRAVTDSASNMKAAIRTTGWKHLPCIAHTLNLIVQESLEHDSELSTIRQKVRSIVTFFKQSVQAKDKLGEIQIQTTGEEKKLIRDVVTRWNSSYYMFERVVEMYQAVNSALCFMDISDIQFEVSILKDATKLLQPFEEAMKEFSADKFISISKIIPLAYMLQRVTVRSDSTQLLKQNLINSMGRRFCNIEANYILAASTLLDPRFKKLGFGDPSACSKAIERLKVEVASTIVEETSSNHGVSLAEQQQTTDHRSELWSFIDDSVASTNSTSILHLFNYYVPFIHG